MPPPVPARASASPANAGARGWTADTARRPPRVSTAEYFENSASPAHSPLPATTPAPRSSARTRHSAAPSSAQSSGPSGSTQVPVVTPNTGDRFSSTAAQNPPDRSAVHQPGGQREQRDERQPHDDRRLAAEQMRRAPAQPPRCRRMVEIAEAQHAPRRDHVAFVDAEPQRRPKRQMRSAVAARISQRQE